MVADASRHYQALRSLPCALYSCRWFRAQVEDLQQLGNAEVEGDADRGEDPARDLHAPLHRLWGRAELPCDCGRLRRIFEVSQELSLRIYFSPPSSLCSGPSGGSTPLTEAWKHRLLKSPFLLFLFPSKCQRLVLGIPSSSVFQNP